MLGFCSGVPELLIPCSHRSTPYSLRCWIGAFRIARLVGGRFVWFAGLLLQYHEAQVCIYIYVYVYVYVYMYICIYVCMYICIYVYMYICIYISVYIYISIYAYM